MDKKTLILIFEIALIIILSVFFSPSGPIFIGDVNPIDEGQFASWAHHMLYGKLPYKDIFITYGPLSAYPLHFLFKFFGQNILLLKIYLVSGTILGALACLMILRELNVRFIFRILGIVCFTLLPIVGFRQAGAVLTMFFLYKAYYSQSKALPILLGVSLCLTFLLSPDMGVFSAVILFLVTLFQLLSSKKVMPILQKMFLTFIGAFLAILASSLITNMGNWFYDYLSATLDLFLNFSGQNVPNGQDFPKIPSIINDPSFPKSILGRGALLYWQIVIYMGFVFFFVYKKLIKPWQKEYTLLTFVTFLGLLFYTILLTRYGHFYFTLAPLVIVSIFFLDKLFKNISSRKSQRLFLSLLFIFVLSAFIFRQFQIYRFEIFTKASYLSGQIDTKTSSQGHFQLNRQLWTRSQLVREIVNQYTKKGDYVFILSDQPLYYLLADRKNPTRFDLPYLAGSKEKRYEIIADLKRNSPRLIIYDQTVWEVDGVGNKVRLPEVFSYIKNNYELVKVRQGIEIYQKK